jgi:hypothetical protein
MKTFPRWQATVVLLAMALLACGSSSSDPDAGSQPDASTPDASTPDAAVETRTLTVTFGGAGTGSVSSSPAGIVDCSSSGGTCTAEFALGTAVTLTQTAGAGYFFAGWSGGSCAGVASCSVTLDADAAVHATFTPVLFWGYDPLPGGPNPNTTTNLWTVRNDGTGATPLTQLQVASAFYPSFSPDFERVAFISNQLTDEPLQDQDQSISNLWVVQADGTGVTALTHQSANVDYPLWTPDGRIVYGGRAMLDGGTGTGPRKGRPSRPMSSR